ncbi:hypothetical protein [Nocardia abscessus]|uniref:hypothetical protein n=1 Tax=Nocardia abscessus TaxID=120957 RepID=UPI002454136A|nr:hypothetical protein [Nocardia abscessus]
MTWSKRLDAAAGRGLHSGDVGCVAGIAAYGGRSVMIPYANASVRNGVAHSARVVSAAALIMFAVSVAFSAAGGCHRA